MRARPRPDTLRLETYEFPRGTSYVLRGPDGQTVYRTWSESALHNWLKRYGYVREG